MSKKALITILIIALIILIGTLGYLFMIILNGNQSDAPVINQQVNSNTNKPAVNTNTNTNQPAGLANPAAVKCEEDGGKLESYQTAGGEDAICIFSDNSICGQWDYFRGDCAKGDCVKSCEKIGTSNEGWYNSCTDELLKAEKCSGKDLNEVVQDIQDEQDMNIIVSSPVSDAQLSSPVKIEGQARVFENEVLIRFKSKDGRTLIEESTTANADIGQFGDFSIEIAYEFTLTKEGYVEVYSLNAKDGSEENIVSIPVKF